MEELIAKRYIKALTSDIDLATIENITEVFSSLAESFKDDKFVSIINNPGINAKDKSDILLEAVKPAKSDRINNLIKR
jgi:F-type H+-transporting ATPase subunit delta